MKDKIEVGEYVRTDEGNIFEFGGYFKSGNIDSMTDKDGILYGNQEKCCKKHSKNIFKSEDIAVLEYYVGKYRKRIARRFEVFKAGHLISFRTVYCDFLYDLNEQKFLDGKGFNPKIKLILTHEQFDWLKYKV